MLSYLAGAMDSDGHFTIRKSGTRARNGDCVNYLYFLKIGLGQITPEVPFLLRDTFGGRVRLNKPGTENSHPIYRYECTCRKAYEACRLLLPFLIIKKDRAQNCIDFQEFNDDHRTNRVVWWWEMENPHWMETSEMVDSTEAQKILGLSAPSLVSQCLRNKTILALPLSRSGLSRHSKQPRFPRSLLERIASERNGPRGTKTPTQKIKKMEEYWQKARSLNKIGINGTQITNRIGHFSIKPIDTSRLGVIGNQKLPNDAVV